MNPGNAALGRGLDVLSALAGPLAARDGMAFAVHLLQQASDRLSCIKEQISDFPVHRLLIFLLWEADKASKLGNALDFLDSQLVFEAPINNQVAIDQDYRPQTRFWGGFRSGVHAKRR